MAGDDEQGQNVHKLIPISCVILVIYSDEKQTRLYVMEVFIWRGMVSKVNLMLNELDSFKPYKRSIFREPGKLWRAYKYLLQCQVAKFET